MLFEKNILTLSELINHLTQIKPKDTLEFDWDPTGESVTHNIYFDFDAGHSISVNCTKYKKSLIHFDFSCLILLYKR